MWIKHLKHKEPRKRNATDVLITYYQGVDNKTGKKSSKYLSTYPRYIIIPISYKKKNKEIK